MSASESAQHRQNLRPVPPSVLRPDVLCACLPRNVITVPPEGFDHLRGYCFRCLCRLRPSSDSIPLPSGEEEKDLRWQFTVAVTALENYGRHFSWCKEEAAKWEGDDKPCICGFRDTLADLRRDLANSQPAINPSQVDNSPPRP